jgi:hypothetical protein
MSAKHPHYLPECVTTANVQLDDRLRSFNNMDLKAYKAVKNGLLSLAIIVFAGYVVNAGADPTVVFSGTLTLLCLLNGIELAEFYNAWEEVRKTQAQNQDREDSR